MLWLFTKNLDFLYIFPALCCIYTLCLLNKLLHCDYIKQWAQIFCYHLLLSVFPHLTFSRHMHDQYLNFCYHGPEGALYNLGFQLGWCFITLDSCMASALTWLGWFFLIVLNIKLHLPFYRKSNAHLKCFR